MTLGNPPSPEEIEDEDRVEPARRHTLLRRTLLSLVGLVSFGILLFVMSGTADAAPADSSTPAQPSVLSVLDQVTSSVSAPLHQVSDTVAPVTNPLVHTVTNVAAPLVKPVVKPLSGTVAAVLAPLAPALKPVTGPLLDAVAPAVGPVTSSLGAQPLTATLGASSEQSKPVNPTPLDPVATGSTNPVETRAGTVASAAKPTAISVSRQIPAPVSEIRSEWTVPARPGHVPGSPDQPFSLLVTSAGSSISGSGGAHAGGVAVTDEPATQTSSHASRSVWSSRRFAFGSCFVHGRDHPR
jgi:hypothetical protein